MWYHDTSGNVIVYPISNTNSNKFICARNAMILCRDSKIIPCASRIMGVPPTMTEELYFPAVYLEKTMKDNFILPEKTEIYFGNKVNLKIREQTQLTIRSSWKTIQYEHPADTIIKFPELIGGFQYIICEKKQLSVVKPK